MNRGLTVNSYFISELQQLNEHNRTFYFCLDTIVAVSLHISVITRLPSACNYDYSTSALCVVGYSECECHGEITQVTSYLQKIVVCDGIPTVNSVLDDKSF